MELQWWAVVREKKEDQHSRDLNIKKTHIVFNHIRRKVLAANGAEEPVQAVGIEGHISRRAKPSLRGRKYNVRVSCYE